MSQQQTCPNCLKPMSRTLDGKGDWICLPCGRRVGKDEDPFASSLADLGKSGDMADLIDQLFKGKKP